MKIIRCGRTEETCDRLEHNMPKELRSLPILLNYGNSKVEDDDDYILINSQEAIKRCIDKGEMFRHIKGYSVDYINLKNPIGVFRGFLALTLSKELVLRKGGKLKCVGSVREFSKLLKKYDYATIKENKKFEYRVLMLYGKPFKIKMKYNKKGGFVNKQENCRFIDINIDDFRELYGNSIFDDLSKAVWNLGIHLCGVDLILNDKGEFKILEVNSGAGMCGRSVREFYRILLERFEC